MEMLYTLKLRFIQIIVFLSIGCLAGNLVFAQSNISNKYGLNVVKDIKILQEQIKEKPANQMVSLDNLDPRPVFDLRYSTTHNFMNKKLYPPLKSTWLRKPAAEALDKVSHELYEQNIGLKIWDGYRPYSVTKKMWKAVKDDRYAADPAKGSGHNRGISVDLTLYDLRTGKELPMPTDFDNFSDSAHQDFMKLPETVLANRNLLKTVMEKYGFIALTTEWWHFYLPNSSDFELLDVPFSSLKKLSKSPASRVDGIIYF